MGVERVRIHARGTSCIVRNLKASGFGMGTTASARQAAHNPKSRPRLHFGFLVVLVIFVGGHWFFAAFLPDAIVGGTFSQGASHFADV